GIMQEERLSSGPLRFNDPRREAMLEPEEVSAVLRLNELGWGAKRIARELGISRNTAKDYIAAGGLGAVPKNATKKGARWSRGVAARAPAPASRQCRRDPPGAGRREEHYRQPAHGRTGGAAVSAGACRGGTGNRAVRDAAR